MDKMKFILLSVLMLIAVLLMPVRVSAERETDTAPTVMYKLINHDCIKLKWNEVTGADGYYIYRTDIGTGKTVKYKSIVKGTDVTIKNLSAETEYIFYVEPINGKNGKTTVGQRSAGTKLTTPKEWYYYDDSKVDPENKIIESSFYRTDYAKTKKEKIYLGDIKAVDEIIYYDGWYYVIGYYDLILSNMVDTSREYFGDPGHKCIARIKEDGSDKELIIDFYSSGGFGYDYQITNDTIYLLSHHKQILEHNYENNKIQFYSNPDWCWLKKISLKNGKVISIASPCFYNWFYVYNNYIYYACDNTYSPNKNKNRYLSCWYDYETFQVDGYDKYYTSYYKMCTNGKDKTLLYADELDIKTNYAYIDNQSIYLISTNSIQKTTLSDSKKKSLYITQNSISDANILNNYIYFSEYSDLNGIKSLSYCRIKPDGTDLTTQDTPFEWYY